MIRLTSQVVEFGKATFSVRKEIEIKQDHFFLLGGGDFCEKSKKDAFFKNEREHLNLKRDYMIDDEHIYMQLSIYIVTAFCQRSLLQMPMV